MVAIAYLAVAIAVVMLVTRKPHRADRPADHGVVRPAAARRRPAGRRPVRPAAGGPARRRADPPVAGRADGSVRTATTNPALPAEPRDASRARRRRRSAASTSARRAGRSLTTGSIVGQSLEPVYDTRSTVILAELLIAPILLAAVFFGAVAIGRRVAEPIEAARQRQLDFTADASHELRTPLAVIEAHTSLALAQDRDVDWYRSAFGRVDHESKRMRRMLEDLLWLARFDASRAAAERGAGRPRGDGGPGGRPLRADRRDAPPDDRVAAPPDGAVIAAPPEWLDRLLGVLLDNACKYAPDGGRVDVTVAVDGSRVVLTVDDSGPGIPEAERTRIFDRFHRGDRPAGWSRPRPRDRRRDRPGDGWTLARRGGPDGGARMGVDLEPGARMTRRQ